MRTAHKTELRFCVLVLPNYRIAVIHALQLRIVYNVNLGVLFYERLAEFNCFRSYVFNVIKTNRTV